MKAELLALLEDAKMELHRAVDALGPDATDIQAAAEALESHHGTVQAVLTLLKLV